MTKLPPAYEEALLILKGKASPQTIIIIRALLLSEHNIVEFNAKLKELSVNEELASELSDMIVDQIATDIALMCAITRNSFRKEIQPLVEEVKEELKSSKYLQ